MLQPAGSQPCSFAGRFEESSYGESSHGFFIWILRTDLSYGRTRHLCDDMACRQTVTLLSGIRHLPTLRPLGMSTHHATSGLWAYLSTRPWATSPVSSRAHREEMGLSFGYGLSGQALRPLVCPALASWRYSCTKHPRKIPGATFPPGHAAFAAPAPEPPLPLTFPSSWSGSWCLCRQPLSVSWPAIRSMASGLQMAPKGGRTRYSTLRRIPRPGLLRTREVLQW